MKTKARLSLGALFVAAALFTQSASGQVLAFDTGSNYDGSNPWVDTSNQGFGFDPWDITVNAGTGFAGNFIGDPDAAGINGMSVESFGMFANPGGSGAFVTAGRPFSSALGIGQTFSVDWGVNWDSDSAGNKGLNLYTGGLGGTEVININQGGSATITINGDNMFTEYGTQVMTLNFERVSSTDLRVFAIGRDSIETYDNTFALGSSAVDAVLFYASDLASGDQRQPYFDNLQIVPEPSAYAFLFALAALAWAVLRRRR